MTCILCLSFNLAHSYTFVSTSNHQIFTIATSDNRLSLPKIYKGSNDGNRLTMKVSRGKSKNSLANTLESNNRQRIKFAGKPGTKHFMDPNKVFLGNLPYDATAEDVKIFLMEHLGTMRNVVSVKIITDWKTGKSKGYGFIQFMEPMAATAAMEFIKGKKLNGRVIRLDQGRKKDDLSERALFVKKRSRDRISEGDAEDQVIDNALNEVEDAEYEEDEQDPENIYTLDDFDDSDDAFLLDDDDDDDFEFDGSFEEIYGTSKYEELDEEEAKNMNREQRRDASKRKPRKKLPHKGFG